MNAAGWRRIVVGALCCVGVWLVGMAFVPVNFSALATVPQSVSITDGSPTAGQPVPAPGLLRLTVVNPGPVEVVLPLVPGGGRLPPEAVRVVEGDWAVTEGGPDRMTASEPGSVIEIDGVYSELDLGVVGSVDGGVVLVEMGDTSVTVDASNEGEWTSVRADFGRRSETQSQRFMWRSHTVAFGLQTDEVDVSIGQLPVTSTEVRSQQQVLVTVGATDSMSAVATGAGVTLAVLLAAAVLTAGLVFVGGLTRRLIGAGVDSWATRGALGFAVLALPTGFLNYFLSVKLILIVLVFSIGIVWVLARRRPRPARPSWAPGAAPLLGVLTSTLAVPMTATRGWSVGFFQTDVVDYLNMNAVFWRIPSLGSGSDFGNGLRLIDFSARAAVDGILPTPPHLSLLAITIALTWLAVVAVAEVGNRLAVGTVGIIAIGALAVGSGALTALWTEGYMSRHLFAVTLLAATCIIVGVVAAGDATPQSWLIVGLVLAVPIAIVPTFVTIAITTGLGLLAYWWRHRATPLRSQPVVAFSLAVLATAGPNMLWLKDSDVTRRYALGTSDIGRYVVVPFHATSRFPATLMGILPFHDHAASPVGTGAPGRSFPLLETIRAWIDTSTTVSVLVGLVGVAVVAFCLLGLLAGRGDGFGMPRGFLVATLGVTALLGVAILREWPAQAYTILMYFWTLAPVVLLMAGLAIGAGIGNSRKRRPDPDHRDVAGGGLVVPYRWAALGLLCVLALFNVASSVLDAGRWMEPVGGELEGRWNYDVVGDVIVLDEYLAQHRPPEEFTIRPVPGEVVDKDSGRVLVNLLVMQLEQASAACTNCARNPANDIINIATLPADADTDRSPDPGVSVLLIGDDRCVDTTTVVRGRSFALCGPTDPESGPDQGVTQDS